MTNNTDVFEPLTDDDVEYFTDPDFSITNDTINMFIGMYVNVNRLKQSVDSIRGKLPSKGDKINVRFENNKSRPYVVMEVRENMQATFKKKDKYLLICKKYYTRSEDSNKYPDEIILGYSRGHFDK